jgi:hypothetical protein
MRLNNRPAAGDQIHLHNIGHDNFDLRSGQAFQVDATTDANGHFLFAHVLPGECGLGRWIEEGHGSLSLRDDVLLTVAPGESTNITLGGNGRPVTGTLELENPKDVPEDAYFDISIHTRFPSPPERRTARHAFPYYEGVVASDKTFRADDVPPGHYIVTVNGLRSDFHSGSRFPPMVTTDVTNIDVPPLADPQKCEPFDIGRIKVSLEFPSEPTASQTPGAE